VKECRSACRWTPAEPLAAGLAAPINRTCEQARVPRAWRASLEEGMRQRHVYLNMSLQQRRYPVRAAMQRRFLHCCLPALSVATGGWPSSAISCYWRAAFRYRRVTTSSAAGTQRAAPSGHWSPCERMCAAGLQWLALPVSSGLTLKCNRQLCPEISTTIFTPRFGRSSSSSRLCRRTIPCSCLSDLDKGWLSTVCRPVAAGSSSRCQARRDRAEPPARLTGPPACRATQPEPWEQKSAPAP
jgi:hypothetical protein